MRSIQAQQLQNEIARLCIEANLALPKDVEQALKQAQQAEPWPPAARVLQQLQQNLEVASCTQLPICQDTGMACVFLEIGSGVHLCDGEWAEAVNEGVRQGYADGYLRKSIVADPLRRTNTGSNTPAQISYDIVPGEQVKITVMPKGFGSENMSRIAMLPPAAGRQGVAEFVVDTVAQAQSNPCPPIIVGVGIGGSFDKAPLLAKKALLRPVGQANADPYYAELESELLQSINELGIGPAGYGGKTTALGLAIQTAPTHIAGLPVAVNISCHATRRASAVL